MRDAARLAMLAALASGDAFGRVGAGVDRQDPFSG
jgi:hypothetical protein